MCASCGWILILYMSSFFFKLFVPCIFSTYGIKTNWCHCFNFIRILPDLYMFRAHRPILRRVHTAVHTIGSVSVLLWSCAQSMWPEQYRHWTNGRVNSCVNSPEDGPVGPKHVEIRQYINKIEIVTSVGFYSIWAHIVFTELTSCPTVNNMKMFANCKFLGGTHLKSPLAVPSREQLRWSGGSVLAFGTQVRGFAPGRSRRIFRAKKSSAHLPSEGK